MFTRMALRHYDLAICMSHRVDAEVQASFPRLRTEVLPDPIDLAEFVPHSRSESRRILGLPNDGCRYVVFGSAAAHNPLKRKWLAEAAVAVAQRTIPNLRLLLATGYPHRMMPTVLSAADVAICTSTTEGWPNFIKEALACNVPFVATDVSDLRLIAEAEPRCRIAADNPEDLGRALCEVLEAPVTGDLRRHVAQMATERHAAALLEIYRSLC
jgi:glycosyltransferase involved in cell wall biosynthesis